MPRGKYPRRPVALEAARAPQPASPAAPPPSADFVFEQPPVDETAGATDKVEPSAPPPVAPTRASKPAPRAAVAPVDYERKPQRFADHAKSRDIDSLPEAELRPYAREIGVSRRDCEGLGVDRLRAACKSHLANHLEALLEA